MLFFDAAQRRIRQQRANMLIDVANALAGGDEAKKLLRNLQKD